jgi:DNA polymerase I
MVDLLFRDRQAGEAPPMPTVPFREAWCTDFEYQANAGENPRPVCAVIREFYSGREIRLWRDELFALRQAPFDITSPDTAMIAYYASAEIGCFLELGWPLPVNIIDLFAEHRVATNGKILPCGNSLLGALAVRRLAHIDAGEKGTMRRLVMERQHWSEQEKLDLLSYCASDVSGLIALLPVMAPTIDWPRALWRGRYMKAAAQMERTGIPIDAPLLNRLTSEWKGLKQRLITEVDKDFGVFEGSTFKQARFADYLRVNGIPWPRLPSGALALDGDTFTEMARNHPKLRTLYELRSSLSELRLTNIAAGSDQRARCMLSAFQSKTGRNQPSATKFIFGPARWIRGLIREQEGRAVAYIDWSAQEIAIAAGLSGDECLANDYATGDLYLSFAKAVGLVPGDATKETHGDVREVCKTIQLGTLFGMGPSTVAVRAAVSECEARDLLRMHRERYRRFWQWIDDTVTTAMFSGSISTVFGWRQHLSRNINPRSLLNFPMQAHGAEAMRAAAIAATETGLEVCCPVHDAFLLSAPIDEIDEAVFKMRRIMAKAARLVTGGIEIRTDAKVVRWPRRYMDSRGQAMWDTVMRLLNQENGYEAASQV